MGKPSSNSQNNSDTPSSINSISSKISGLANCEIHETTPKLSLNLRPKALIQSEQQHHQSSFRINQDNTISEAYNGQNPHSILQDNNYATINHNGKDFSPSHHGDASRIPLPMTEIEPHYSRDSYISPKGKKKSVGKGKQSIDSFYKNKEKEPLGNLLYIKYFI